MTVDVQRPVALDVAVDGDGVVRQHPDEAFAAQISLSPPTLVVALRAADEAPLAVPVGRLPVVAGRAGHVLAPRPVVAASGRREVADILVVIDRIARARCDHCAVAGDERHDGRGEAEPGCEHHHGRAPRCFLPATVTRCGAPTVFRSRSSIRISWIRKMPIVGWATRGIVDGAHDGDGLNLLRTRVSPRGSSQPTTVRRTDIQGPSWLGTRVSTDRQLARDTCGPGAWLARFARAQTGCSWLALARRL